MDQYARTELLFGSEAMEKLRASRIAVFGIGGIGGYAVRRDIPGSNAFVPSIVGLIIAGEVVKDITKI